MLHRFAAISLILLAAGMAQAEPIRIVVSIENLAPERGTSQTPFWVGFHEGIFDLYDGNTLASNDPQPGSVAMERICEDGNTGPLSDDFAALSLGVDATLPGPAGPLAPGDTATGSFVLESSDPNVRYFSYASMILPSNDFCIANGNPQAHEIFDDAGNLVAAPFFVTGAETLDAGTEVNDELPENTAFFGQATPDTGVDENGLIGTIGVDRLDVSGFLPPGSGGILDDPRFAMADFSVPGYPFVKISFAAAPAVAEDLDFSALLEGEQEVPPVDTRARGVARYALREEGTVLSFDHRPRGLRDVVGAHLQLAPEGENGPIVAFLLPAELSELSRGARRRIDRRIAGELSAEDLVGPLTGLPLDALVAEILAGNVYANIHTERFPSGELRGQLELGALDAPRGAEDDDDDEGEGDDD
ncbi:MAG: spondin domain-containing protein [Myxococcota bacterium]|nr:spondin domain-containing protein [Myxococcota bacterium]